MGETVAFAAFSKIEELSCLRAGGSSKTPMQIIQLVANCGYGLDQSIDQTSSANAWFFWQGGFRCIACIQSPSKSLSSSKSSQYSLSTLSSSKSSAYSSTGGPPVVWPRKRCTKPGQRSTDLAGRRAVSCFLRICARNTGQQMGGTWAQNGDKKWSQPTKDVHSWP